MAEEVKKVITIEVGKSITSVRDFKKHIEDLRGALLGLNEDSEEYATIAEQIATDQARLNDVMKIGKTNTDAAAGSYNELNNQLKSLRAQYKALSETERNSTTGQAILQNISKLDTQLKDIDASMGQYQRNVGNYEQAFDSVFRAISNEVSKINPTIGQLIKTVQSLVPAFKAVGTSATAAGTSIKAAISSTGIGLLLVALGEIVAHWKEISSWVDKVLGRQKEITTEVKNSAAQAKELRDRYKEALDYQNRLRRAQGKTDLEIINDNIKDANREIEIREDLNGVIDDYLEKIKEARTAVAKSNAFDFGIPADVADKVKEITDNISEDLMGLGESWGKVLEFKRKVENEYSIFDLGGELADFERFLQEQKKNNDAIIDEQTANTAQFLKEQSIATAAYVTETENRAKAATNALKSELDQRKAKYEEDKKYIEENITRIADRNKALANLEAEYQADVKRINQKAGSEASERLKQEQKQAKELFDEIKKKGKTELEILDDNYVEQLVLLKKFGYDTTELTKQWQEEREKIVLENYKKEQEDLKANEEAKLKIKHDAFQKELDAQSSSEYLDTSAASTMWTINTKTHETDENLENQKNDRLYQIAEQGYLDRIDLYHQYLSTLEEGTEEYFNTSKDLHQQEMELAELQYDYQVELEDRALAKKKKNIQIAQGMLSAYSGMWSSMVDYMLQGEEEGSEKWKAFKISEAVISTLAGMAGAFMQGMNSAPMPWGAIIGAAGATTAMITGMAQVNQIKSTQMGSGNTSITGITASGGAGVEPLLNEQYDLQRLTNLSLQGDSFAPGNTQVYVLESDIEEVGNRVQVREQNATF